MAVAASSMRNTHRGFMTLPVHDALFSGCRKGISRGARKVNLQDEQSLGRVLSDGTDGNIPVEGGKATAVSGGQFEEV